MNWRIVDVEKYLFSLQDHERTVHTTIQHYVSKEVEFLSNDALFNDKNEISSRIEEALTPVLEEWGIKMVGVNLRNAPEWDGGADGTQAPWNEPRGAKTAGTKEF